MNLSDIFNALLAAIVKNMGLILNIVIIIILTMISLRFLSRMRRRIEKKIIEERIDPAQQSRLKTLLRAGSSAGQLVIIALATMMILMTIGIDLAPLLASVGVASLAISLGAQTLIKDFIGGVLILLENQFNVGDDIQVGLNTGTVEKITLRTTAMRDSTGKLFIVPNGDIRTLSNNSLDWSKAIVDLNIHFDANMPQVLETLQKAIATASNDVTLSAVLLEPPQIIGWNNLTDWSIQVRLSAKTRPGQQTAAASALRMHALQALQAANIPLAVPSAQSSR